MVPLHDQNFSNISFKVGKLDTKAKTDDELSKLPKNYSEQVLSKFDCSNALMQQTIQVPKSRHRRKDRSETMTENGRRKEVTFYQGLRQGDSHYIAMNPKSHGLGLFITNPAPRYERSNRPDFNSNTSRSGFNIKFSQSTSSLRRPASSLARQPPTLESSVYGMDFKKDVESIQTGNSLMFKSKDLR